ncbi:MAG TPA: metal ABC transporter permease [Hyphomicrobiales bacterium]|nr:metal ABC transporter permease [Hyphomicrobiales bacterium]
MATRTATTTAITAIGTMLHYDFMRNAFAAAGIVAAVAGVVGYFVVLRAQAFAGHALSHVGFAGATGALLIGLPPLAGLLVLSVGAGVAMGLLGDRLAQRDLAIGMVLALALGLGLLFVHFYTAGANQATALLFGNVLAVGRATLGWLALLALACLALMAAMARPLVFATLHPELAEAKGVSLRLLGVLFLATVGIAVAEASQIVGVLLVFTLLIGPAATATRLTGRLGAGVLLAAVLALAEAWAGLVLAYYTDWPASSWITLVSVAAYGLSLLPRGRRVAAAAHQHGG